MLPLSTLPRSLFKLCLITISPSAHCLGSLPDVLFLSVLLPVLLSSISLFAATLAFFLSFKQKSLILAPRVCLYLGQNIIDRDKMMRSIKWNSTTVIWNTHPLKCTHSRVSYSHKVHRLSAYTHISMHACVFLSCSIMSSVSCCVNRCAPKWEQSFLQFLVNSRHHWWNTRSYLFSLLAGYTRTQH